MPVELKQNPHLHFFQPGQSWISELQSFQACKTSNSPVLVSKSYIIITELYPPFPRIWKNHREIWSLFSQDKPWHQSHCQWETEQLLWFSLQTCPYPLGCRKLCKHQLLLPSRIKCVQLPSMQVYQIETWAQLLYLWSLYQQLQPAY